MDRKMLKREKICVREKQINCFDIHLRESVPGTFDPIYASCASVAASKHLIDLLTLVSLPKKRVQDKRSED